jgi:hypothetical protein
MLIRRLCSVLIQLLAAVFSSARAQDVPKGEAAFTEYVAAQLRREGAPVEVKGPLTLVVGGGLQANLGLVFAFCSGNADGCKSEIAAYVKGIAQLHSERPPPLSKDAIRIIVRNRAYVQASPSETAEMQWRPLAGELVMPPVMDEPRAVYPLSEKNNEKLGLSAHGVLKGEFTATLKDGPVPRVLLTLSARSSYACR